MVRVFDHGAMGRGMGEWGARCSSEIRVFDHGAVGRGMGSEL